MATYPNTGSTLEADNGASKTSTALSTNIIIEVSGNAIGAIQRMQVQESRSIKMIDEIGTDGHIDSAPQSSTNITGSCERIRFDNLRVAAAFSRSWVHVKSQRRPFDILIKDIFAAEEQVELNADNPTVLNTVIKNVWIKDISYTYQADNFIISESMSWEAETIYSFIGSSQSNVVGNLNGGRNLILPADSSVSSLIERAADRGERRGALDGSGLLFAVDNAPIT